MIELTNGTVTEETTDISKSAVELADSLELIGGLMNYLEGDILDLTLGSCNIERLDRIVRITGLVEKLIDTAKNQYDTLARAAKIAV